MDIRVSGHQMDTGDALRTHVSDRMNAIAEKYFARAISAHATFGKAPHDAIDCDIVAHVMQGLVIKGHGRAREAHAAFEAAAERVEKQLRRYMRRLKDRHGAGNGASVDDIPSNAGYTVFGADNDQEEAGDAPVIVAETRVDIPDAAVADAVMMLDLRNTNALLFRNAQTGIHNMVYRREDGSIGWVEPERG
ncbi:MAG: ribosome-associated translation inhibitor RaiA [Sphingomonadales bacterium]|nr:ribosome-associated translation inhibitor RaiA [Sphingomonadales bacterium]